MILADSRSGLRIEYVPSSTCSVLTVQTPFPPVRQGISGKTPLSKVQGKTEIVLDDGAGVNTEFIGGNVGRRLILLAGGAVGATTEAGGRLFFTVGRAVTCEIEGSPEAPVMVGFSVDIGGSVSAGCGAGVTGEGVGSIGCCVIILSLDGRSSFSRHLSAMKSLHDNEGVSISSML